MKNKLLALILGSTLIQSLNAASTLPFTDHFAYASGNNLGAVGGAGNWNGSSTAATLVSGNLDGTSLGMPASSGNMVAMGTGTGGTYNLFASASGDINSGKVYCSFLLKVNDATSAITSGERVISMNIQNGSSTRYVELYFKNVSGAVQLGLAKNGSAASYITSGAGSSVADGNVYLVVMSQEFITPGTSDDIVKLWVNPTSLGGAEDGSPDIVINTGADASSTTGTGRLYFSGGVVLNLDELRMGTTWADVTPTTGPVIGEKLGFTTQPANAQVNTTMNPVVVQVQNASGAAAASNGVPVTLALTSGSGVLSGTLTQNTDATGKATFSNLSMDTIGTGKQLTATASGIGAGLASAASASFSITAEPTVSGLVITQSVMVSSGFKVAGVTEQPGVFTQILGSSDVGREQTNWMIVSYQNAGASGEVSFTNPVSPALPNVFYRLRTGNNVTKLEPPSIGTPPHSQIVSPGTTATFTVSGVGPQLQYLWYFNGNPIPGATTSSLVIPNAQAGNVGNYHVVVANPAGTVTSAIATLGVGNVQPNITTEPQNQTVNAGGTAIFAVSATGTSPLSYQWYANTNSAIADATNASLTVTGVTTNDNGKKYRVIVSNNFGSDTSADATLTVNPVPTDLPSTNLVGWAAYAGVTGGTGGTETTVNTYAALRAACRAAGPIIIYVDGILVPNEDYCYIEGYDKTIVGVGTNSGLAGRGFRVGGTNIILANMTFSSTNSNADGITIDNSSHGTGRNVWVDHCTFYDCSDGSVDVTKGADYVTVSWCKFHYAPIPTGQVNHEFVNLIGSSDTDNPGGVQYHVTFHHNWYGSYCRERMPSVRFGRVHVFNNYYDCFDNNYCVRTRLDAEVLVENNYFLGVQNPWERFVTGTPGNFPGKLMASGNITNNCTFVNGWTGGAIVIPGNDTLGSELNPPLYTYTLTPASDVPYYVQTYAGHGKYPYVP